MSHSCTKAERAADAHALLSHMKAAGDFGGVTGKTLSSIDATITQLAAMKVRPMAAAREAVEAEPDPEPRRAGRTWTRIDEPDRFILRRGDGLFEFIVHRHVTHFHAEQIMPFDEDGMGRFNPEAIRDEYLRWIAALGDNVVTV